MANGYFPSEYFPIKYWMDNYWPDIWPGLAGYLTETTIVSITPIRTTGFITPVNEMESLTSKRTIHSI
jgi:hypothetical protein